MKCNILPTLLVIGAIAIASCDTQQVDVAAETDSLHARSQELVAAEAAMDVEASLAFWAEDAVAHPAGAPQIKGLEAIADLYRQFFEGGQLKEFSGTTTHMSVSQAGDLAYEYGINRFVLSGPEGDLLDIGKYLAVWKKVDGNWFVAALSFTSDAPEPIPSGEQQ